MLSLLERVSKAPPFFGGSLVHGELYYATTASKALSSWLAMLSN
jgi:hypothetical protein